MTDSIDTSDKPQSLTTIALFGANGQIGERILQALNSSNQHSFKTVAFIPPHSNIQQRATRDNLATDLEGVDAVVSALNGPALEAQGTIQDAAADAGVKRFHPSEYGLHQIYRKPNDPMGLCSSCRAVNHPATRSGKMSFTMISCGDSYNQAREKVWCPWTQPPNAVDKNTIHVIGNPDAGADYTHMNDFANFLVATLVKPAKSENQYLNMVSDTISHSSIAKLLEKYSDKKTDLNVQDEHAIHKETQGKGEFVRPKSQIQNGIFPDLKVTSFQRYFQERVV
ncbi:hypothetical protein BKA66DRAFT_561740 [Pyrenochaeta sp. MPI-SDFR-AT-0127]|nr:hypothetical protein BKA66DRAFT_561740 [Pyrenochaeta sp. MPI-SDFR-AT-0127]